MSNPPVSTSTSSMKTVAREWLPPVLYRALRSAWPKAKPVRAFLDVVGVEGNVTMLHGGASVRHRGSVADLGVIDQIFGNKDYDLSRFKRNLEIQSFYETTATPWILDCGANIGASAIWFSNMYPKATVTAVEPERENFRLLQENSKGAKVSPVNAAVAAKPGKLQLFDPGDGEWAFSTIAGGKGKKLYEVPALSIDELLAGQNGTPFILKIDIEGAEQDLFTANGETIDQFPVVIIELHDWMLPGTASSRPFLQWHSARDRDFVFLGENVFSFCNVSMRRPARAA